MKLETTVLSCWNNLLFWPSRGVRYHEPEYWKFGDEGNRYFRHATGQLYAISKDLATYIQTNELVLGLLDTNMMVFFCLLSNSQ